MVEVSATASKQLNTVESQQVKRELLFFDEVTNEVAVMEFTLEDVFDRSKWDKLKLPSIYMQQKKRA